MNLHAHAQDTDWLRLKFAEMLLLKSHEGLIGTLNVVNHGLLQIQQELAKVRRLATIQDLPDEILMHIFELMCVEDFHSSFILRQSLSIVCKRWRDLAYACPQLWNSLVSTQSSGHISSCLERVKNSGLKLTVIADFPSNGDTTRTNNPYNAEFLEQVLPFSLQWERFELCSLTLPVNKATGLFMNVRDQCRSLTLPKLQTLRLTWTEKYDTAGEQWMDQNDLHFYASWNMPILSKLEVENFIPLSCFGPSLVSCKINMTSWMERDMARLLQFIGSLERLRELELRLDGYDDDTWPIAPTSLPTLRKLSLIIDFYEDLDCVARLIGLLDFPNVTDMNLEVEMGDWMYFQDLLPCFENGRSFPSVKHLNICLRRRSTAFDHYIDVIFKAFPNLEHYGMSAHDSEYYPSTDCRLFSCPHLKSLRFERCDAFDGRIADALLQQCERDGRLDEFGKLEVFDCPTFRGILSREGFPNEKLVWKNSNLCPVFPT